MDVAWRAGYGACQSPALEIRGRLGVKRTSAAARRTDSRCEHTSPQPPADLFCDGRALTLMMLGWDRLSHRVHGPGQRIVIQRKVDRCSNRERLSRREFQMVYLAAHGLASKQIAAELSLSATAVRATLSRAIRKLRLRGCSQLPAFWYGLGERPTRSIRTPGNEIVVFDSVLGVSEPAEPLTSAERSVLRALINGEDNCEIAASRRTSPRTVANQVAALFKKFGTSSRAELAAESLLLRRASATNTLASRRAALARSVRETSSTR